MRKPIILLDESLQVTIFYEPGDCDFDDNVRVSIVEDCPPHERLFQVGETNFYLTAQQARDLAQALMAAAADSEKNCPEGEES